MSASMGRGKNDSRGRPLKFSFCEIFGRDEKAVAWAAFMRVVLEWENAEKAMQEDIEDIDTPEGEGVRFNDENFTDWLQEKKNDSVKFLHNYDAEQWLPDELEKNPVWPYDGYILKWTMYGERLDTGGRDIQNLIVLAEKGAVSDILPSENDNDEESARKIPFDSLAGEIVRELEENSDARLKEGSLVIIVEALNKLQSANINPSVNSVSEQKISQRNIHSIRKKLSTMLEAVKAPKLDKIRGCWVIGSRSNVEALKRKIDSLYV